MQDVSQAVEEEGLGLLLLPGRTDTPLSPPGESVATLVRRLPTVLVDVARHESGPVVGIDDLGAAERLRSYVAALATIVGFDDIPEASLPRPALTLLPTECITCESIGRPGRGDFAPYAA